jgi:hypothetical protein
MAGHPSHDPTGGPMEEANLAPISSSKSTRYMPRFQWDPARRISWQQY